MIKPSSAISSLDHDLILPAIDLAQLLYTRNYLEKQFLTKTLILFHAKSKRAPFPCAAGELARVMSIRQEEVGIPEHVPAFCDICADDPEIVIKLAHSLTSRGFHDEVQVYADWNFFPTYNTGMHFDGNAIFRFKRQSELKRQHYARIADFAIIPDLYNANSDTIVDSFDALTNLDLIAVVDKLTELGKQGIYELTYEELAAAYYAAQDPAFQTTKNLRGKGRVDANKAKTATGIDSRHIALGYNVYSLGNAVAERLVDQADLDPETIDVIIAGSGSKKRDALVSKTVADHLGITVPCFDLEAACATDAYAQHFARALIEADANIQTVLTVVPEKFTDIVDYSQWNTMILFGDAASATLLRANDQPGYISTEVRGYVSGREDLSTQFGYGIGLIKNLEGFEPVLREGFHIKMDGAKVFKWVTDQVFLDFAQFLKQMGSSVDIINPHMANARFTRYLTETCRVAPDQVLFDPRYGNTSGASQGVGLALARSKGLLTPANGDYIDVARVGMGAGPCAGFAVHRF